MDNIRTKIMFLISHLPKEGPVQVVLDIVKNIDFSYFDVTIVTFKKENENSIYDHFEKLPVKIVYLNESGRFNLFSCYRKLKAIVSSENIKLVHSHCFSSLLLNSFVSNVANIHTIHVYPSIQNIAMKGVFVGGLMNVLTKLLIKHIQVAIACSESVRDEFFLKDSLKVDCIQNGVTPLLKTNASKKELKQFLNLDPNFKYFISVGRFSAEKNFSFLVDCFRKLKLKGYKLIILGEGKLFNQISNIDDESIILPGFKNNVKDYLFSSDYYVSSSLTEGLPLSVLEAMSAGLPILLSDIKPHEEVFLKAGFKEIGLAFSCAVTNDFSVKLNELLSKNYISLSENVLSTFNDNFSAKKMSDLYQQKYISLIEF